ncbi:MAG: CPBP family intramembrane glutamic endopeptidase [Pseudomonadota bacterium]
MNHLERGLDGQNQWWKYIITFFVSLLGSVFLVVIVAVLLFLILDFLLPQDLSATIDSIRNSSAGMAGNLDFIVIVLPLAVGLIIACWMFRWLHKRNYTEVINGTKRIRWGRFFFAASLWGLINLSILLFGLVIQPDNFSLNFNLVPFLVLVLISVSLVPLQTTMEEILFRGYLAQGVASWTRSRWWVLIIPSILFAGIHIANPEVAKYGFWLIMPLYLILGLIMGLITILDDGIELAMGLHAINNLYVTILVTFEGSALATPALLVQKNFSPSLAAIVVLALSGMFFVAVASRRYGWNFAVLNKKVETQ